MAELYPRPFHFVKKEILDTISFAAFSQYLKYREKGAAGASPLKRT